MKKTDEHGGDVDRKTERGWAVPGLGCQHCPAAFFTSEGHDAHMKERHSNEARPESWSQEDEETGKRTRIDYVPNVDRHSPHTWALSEAGEDWEPGKKLSVLQTDHEGKVLSIQTHPDHLREGHATALWNHATRLANATRPAPKHSEKRTVAGDRWAKKIGGELPKRTPVSKTQFRGFVWGE